MQGTVLGRVGSERRRVLSRLCDSIVLMLAEHLIRRRPYAVKL